MIKLTKYSIFKFLCLASVVYGGYAYAQTSSILPPAKTTFLDNNGKPLVSGKVEFYIPGTTTPKMTWQDAGETIPNTNPVTLDGAGRAIILGDGSYRQIVRDKNGNLIWDQITSSTGSGGGGGGTPTVGDGDPVGIVKPWAGFVTPYQYAFAYGQEFARSSYPELFQAITIQMTVNCTIGSSTLSGVPDTSQLSIGSPIESSCLNSGSTILSKTLSTVVASSNAIISSTSTARFFPYGNGNGIDTFNLPDYRGKTIAGRDNMGGIASNRLTTAYFGADPSATGASGGAQSKTLTTAQLPNSSPAFTGTPATINVTTVRSDLVFGTVAAASDGSGGPIGVVTAASRENNAANSTGSYTPAGSIAALGSGNAFSIIQPTQTANYIIKILPDTNPNSYFGVASIGGMYGVIACGDGLTCSGNTINLNAPTGGTVTSVDTGNCLTGGPITSSGMIDLGTSCNMAMLQFSSGGTSNDTTGVQAAFTACTSAGGCVLTCTTGVLYTIDTITVGSQTTVQGCNFKQRVQGTHMFNIDGVQNVRFENNIFLGNTVTSGLAAAISGDTPLWITNSTGVWSVGNYFTRFGLYTEYSKNSTDIVIANNRSYAVAFGPRFMCSTRVTITGNIYRQTSLYSATPTNAQFALGPTLDSDVCGVNSYVTMTGNVVQDFGYAQAYEVHSGYYITISNNLSINNSICVSVNLFANYDGGSRISITGNVCEGLTFALPTDSDIGIAVIGGGSLPRPAWVTITGNTLHTFNRSNPTSSDACIIADSVDYLTISGNTMSDCGGNGIALFRSTSATISGNTIAGIVTAGGSNNGVLLASGASITGTIMSNSFISLGTNINAISSGTGVKYLTLNGCNSVTTCN